MRVKRERQTEHGSVQDNKASGGGRAIKPSREWTLSAAEVLAECGAFVEVAEKKDDCKCDFVDFSPGARVLAPLDRILHLIIDCEMEIGSLRRSSRLQVMDSPLEAYSILKSWVPTV